jgi:hypothetical protein
MDALHCPGLHRCPCGYGDVVMGGMTEKEIRDLVERAAKEAAHEAVKETLLTLGIDADDALEVQRDMQHVRDWRNATSAAKKQGLITVIGILTAGIIGLIWVAIKGNTP